MNDLLPIVYVGALLAILASVGVFLLRQILRTRRTEKTLADLQAKLKDNVGTPKEYYELGNIYLSKKLYAQAGRVLEKALKSKGLEPENRALVLNALGYSYFAREQYDIATRQYKEALKCDPTYTFAWNNLGKVYEQKKLVVQAIGAYEETLKIDPNNEIAKRRVEALSKRVSAST